ncbi:hypothetical protein PVAND_014858 [Polypedilum vanderplanki]|uniref:Uncharacterized protein n=1 Tax=Polypedilum vanderplanki TaxID=319348 RepID=A0A9J6BBA8_POLVA|nr:hypothetical protein PVAND_014858 [Polypedilum vanderplanki]
MTRIEIFGSNMTKKFLLEEMENLKVPKVQLIRHKRQTTSSASQKILNDLQTTKPQLKGIDPLFNFYLTIIWKLIVRLQKNCYSVSQYNIANLQNQLIAHQAQASAICTTITVATTTLISSTTSSSAYNHVHTRKGQYGNDIYVGAGVGGVDLAPGSLEPKVLNGVTVVSGWVVYNVTTNVTYLAIPSTCTCKWISQGNLDTEPALVKLRGYYWVGRHTFADGSFVVGKIWKEPTWYINYADDHTEKEITTYDVLQCFDTSNTTSVTTTLATTTVNTTTTAVVTTSANTNVVSVATAAPPKCANCGLFSSCIIGSPINCVCDAGKVQIPCLTIILGYCCL